MFLHNRIISFIYLVIAVLAFCNSADIAEAKKNVNLLLIDSQDSEPYKTIRGFMLKELASLGYAEGKNLTIKYWSVQNREGRAKRVWLEEKDKHYDAVYTSGTMATFGFSKYALGQTNFKVVFAAPTDPVGLGVIDNFQSQPKSNFTGICYPVKVQKRLRFIIKTMPDLKKIGVIYADMPQSKSYNKWLREALETDEFKDIEILFREVPFVASEMGHKRMAMLAEKHVKELNSQVDIFMSASDQLGTQRPYAEIVYRIASKPLLGIGRKDVMDNWGATFSIYPSLEQIAQRAAYMLKEIFEGRPVKDIIPEWPDFGVAFDMNKAKKFGISIPDDLLKAAGNDIIRQ